MKRNLDFSHLARANPEQLEAMRRVAASVAVDRQWDDRIERITGSRNGGGTAQVVVTGMDRALAATPGWRVGR